MYKGGWLLELEKKELTAREIGRMGGLSTKERHGREHFIRMGRKAAEVLKQRYGQAHYMKMAEARRRKKNEPSNAVEEERPSMTASEAGRKGGKIVLEKYGPAHFIEAGRKGGSTTRERYGSEHYSRIGRIGGRAKARNRNQGAATRPLSEEGETGNEGKTSEALPES